MKVGHEAVQGCEKVSLVSWEMVQELVLRDGIIPSQLIALSLLRVLRGDSTQKKFTTNIPQ